MNYSKQLFEDILGLSEVILSDTLNDEAWRVYNYLLDLYYLKFGVNLRLTELSVQDAIKQHNEVHGE